MSATDDVAAATTMRRAIALAELGLGSTSPNPIVGCVIVGRDGSVVGEGYHVRAGEAHAEVIALRDAGGRAFGATAFVTLEPCRHIGRTPPCTRALIDAGVSRVVFAVADPDPLAGHGADELRAAGVLVEEGLLGDEAARSNAAWLHHARTGRPFVTWKYAATLDGRVAAIDGTSRWITGDAARHDVHLLRARSDAIVVGTGTVLIDDPRLDVRLPDTSNSNRPLRVVVGHRRVPPDSKVLDDAAPTVLLNEHDPKSVLAYLNRARRRQRAARGWPDVGGRVRGRRDGRPHRCLRGARIARWWAGGARRRGNRNAGIRLEVAHRCGRSDRRRRPDHRVPKTDTNPRGVVVFTGIVEELGTIVAVNQTAVGDERAVRVTIDGPLVSSDVAVGDSIAVSGVCLTVVDAASGRFSADVMLETLTRSTLHGAQAGTPVNLERAVTLQTRLGGHLVQGHVDGTGTVVHREHTPRVGRRGDLDCRLRSRATSWRRARSPSTGCR